jgi:cytochrome subunit of sulfide dehydrogenase
MKKLLLPTTLAALLTAGLAVGVIAQTPTPTPSPSTPPPAAPKPSALPPGAGGAPPLPVTPPAAATPAPPPPPAFAASNLTPLGVRSMAATCSACHGTNGVSAGGAIVGLAGMNKEYFVTQMKLFREGKREATLMHQIARGYTDAETNAMADYFAAQKR